MGLDGYLVHNNFVYKTTSPNILTYSVLILVFAYIFYQMIWPSVRRMAMCGLRVAVNIIKTYIYQHPSLLQVYHRHTGAVRKSVRPVSRFKARYRRLDNKHRASVIISIRKWAPPSPSPLTAIASCSSFEISNKDDKLPQDLP